MDKYLGNTPEPSAQRRLDIYNARLDHPDIEPLSDEREREAIFDCSMATNPDQIMWAWNSVNPVLIERRSEAQSASLFLGFRKK